VALLLIQITVNNKYKYRIQIGGTLPVFTWTLYFFAALQTVKCSD